MAIVPEGEPLRKAIRWISDQRADNPEAGFLRLVEDAALKFNLPPKDQEFLMKWFTEKKTGDK